MSDIEGSEPDWQAAREAVSECGQRMSFKVERQSGGKLVANFGGDADRAAGLSVDGAPKRARLR
jgi:predicted NUDIX family NTP pyrophosphohydrolase